MSGKTPFLRGTMRMLGQASEVLGKDPRTKPVVVLQLSWSAGDHIVARENLKTLNDLSWQGPQGAYRLPAGRTSRRAALRLAGCRQDQPQRGGNRLGADLTGPQGPAETFRKDDTIDACCVITPDMIGLTGGSRSTGSGAEGTVKGAHVLNSTRDMSRSIADVYAVRSDWYRRTNRDVVQKFVAGYLKATERVVAAAQGVRTDAADVG